MKSRQVKTLTQAFRVFTRHTSPLLLILILLSFLAFRLTSEQSFGSIEILLALGVMLYWPFQEWWMHRALLHLPPISWRGQSYEMNFARIHRLHHADPRDLELAFLPPAVVITSLIAFTSLFYWSSGSFERTATWMVAASLSTLTYEWVHFLTHTDYKPRGSYYRRIWKLHRWHHYKNEHYWFSFTVPWVDQWFGTGPQPTEVPHSPTAKSLRPSPTEAAEVDSKPVG